MSREKVRNKSAKKKATSYFDYNLLFIIIFLIGFGFVMMYSTSSYNAQIKFGDSAYYLKKQMLASGIGIVVMLFVTFMDYHIWRRFAPVAYIGSIILILLVLSPLGMTLNGARRWIGIGTSLSFQPAEAAKLGLIVFLAYFIERKSKSIRRVGTYIMLLMFTGIIAGMIYVITDNLSSAIIVAGIGFVMLFVASPKYSHFIVTGVIAIAGFVLLMLFEGIVKGSFRFDRIVVWLNPEKYPQEGGFQVLQALYAIGSGGILGKGLGNGIQKLGFVPEAQNDMIFTIICEELGLIGAIAVIGMFVFMIWRFMIIANNAPDLFGSMLVVGVLAHIAIQVVLNIAVVTNTIPNTGVTLPFISYGGTSVVFLMMEMGMVLSVSRRIRYEE